MFTYMYERWDLVRDNWRDSEGEGGELKSYN